MSAIEKAHLESVGWILQELLTQANKIMVDNEIKDENKANEIINLINLKMSYYYSEASWC